MELNKITETIIGCAIEVHKALGPGLLESAYMKNVYFLNCKKRDYLLKRQHPVLVVYKEVKLECGYRIDLLVEKNVVVELKTVDAFNPVHEAQILTYMKFANKPIGLLINFNVALLKRWNKKI